MESQQGGIKWRRSSYCGHASCLEMCRDDQRVLVRNSAAPHGAQLELSAALWREFVEAAKAGAFG
ncbi:DUF397 domain-containing protein [Cryptosporangium aurantiacum]|uniref:DUF397 domain-containing protein n=1 Tax=Cryptosporangium aurantiacum TaxID=134849 RepID=UPI000934FE41